MSSYSSSSLAAPHRRLVSGAFIPVMAIFRIFALCDIIKIQEEENQCETECLEQSEAERISCARTKLLI